MPVSQSLSDDDSACDVADALVVTQPVLDRSVLSELSAVVSDTRMLSLLSLLASESLLGESSLLLLLPLLLLLVYTSRAQRSSLSLLLMLVTAWLPERTELLLLLLLMYASLSACTSSPADSDSAATSYLRFNPRPGLMACAHPDSRTSPFASYYGQDTSTLQRHLPHLQPAAQNASRRAY